MTNEAIARGRKSCTSPSSFMACVRHISPPVPVTTTKMRMAAVRMSVRSFLARRAVRRPVNQHDPENNQYDSDPARRGNLFAQKNVRQQRDQRVSNRGE